jgi:hypothetical protein
MANIDWQYDISSIKHVKILAQGCIVLTKTKQIYSTKLGYALKPVIVQVPLHYGIFKFNSDFLSNGE